jgi:putative proteasome-type protease
LTYCVAVLLDDGLVFASDSRTNAGIDQVSSFRKMRISQLPGERVIVILSSGNLSVTQNALNTLDRRARNACTSGAPSLSNCASMADVAALLDHALQEVKQRDGPYLQQGNIEIGASFIVGGQIKGERPRLFLLTADGEIREADAATPYFQIGETKYGKPIIDRIIRHDTSLRDTAKCLLISFDSTMRSNVSVGLPIDLCSCRTDTLTIAMQQRITDEDPYFHTIHRLWSEGVRQVFADLPDPFAEDSKFDSGCATRPVS